MSLVDFAKDEFKRLNIDVDNKTSEDDFDIWGANCVIELLEVLSKQGHSGLSAGWTLDTFNRLANYKPLSPLTGKEDEWFLISEEENLYMNKRCPSVFSTSKDGTDAYFLDGRVFIDKDGCAFTNKHSKVYLTFPCDVDSLEAVHIKENSEEHMKFMYDTGIDPFEDHYTCESCTSCGNDNEEEVVVTCSSEDRPDVMYDPETDQVLTYEGYLPDSDKFIESSLVEYTKDNINKEVSDQLRKIDNELYPV